MKYVFRADNTNVGDWWSPPWKYFDFHGSASIYDILDTTANIRRTDTLLIGGGGLGAEFFRPHLKRIANTGATAIVWGAGVDTRNSNPAVLSSDADYDLYGNYFDFADDIGLRVYADKLKHDYVPCASCMSPLFDKYRDVKPTNKIGVYNHKRVILASEINIGLYPVEDNSGYDLESKLKFLSSCEYIVTNTYHGVYWATLLNRKVICIPFKSGLFSFKFKPTYTNSINNISNVINQCVNYSDSLEDSRQANRLYYEKIMSKYESI